jgi:Domain of unknown function (DUF222)
MRQDPFPSQDDEEPPDSPGSDDGEGPAQGLYVCLPSEGLDVARFAQHGQSDAMPPGPMLASVVHALAGDDAEGLAALSDDQLLGVIAATRRLESRVAWTQLAALAEFASRRPAEPAGRGRSTQPCEFAADELAGELHLTWQSAAGQIAYAQAVAGRLPRTFAALAAGRIHPVHLRIVEDETSVLSAEDAAAADAELAGTAGSMTFGRLRSDAHRLILKLDPEAAKKRKAAARQDAHVRRFREDSGNAGMVARELPPDEVLASWQHVEQRALDLRAAGLPGTLQDLRVRAYLDLLQERDARTALPAPDSAAPDGTSGPGGPQDGAEGPGAPPDGGNDPGGPPDETGGGGPDGTGGGGPGGTGGGGPGGNGGPGPAPAGTGPGGSGHAAPHSGPAVAALVNLTVPLDTVTGRSETPGDAVGYGLLDADSARELAAAAARHPRTRWCLTALAPDGTAAAHACLRGPPGPLPWQAGPQAAASLRALSFTWTRIIRGPCDHAQAERRYRPGRLLQHLVRARNARCTAPGCGQPAAACDLDHTEPWDHGGPTCPCNLSPLCRHHHRCKQAEGWRLEMPEPGVLIWHTPAGRSYATTPTVYPV